MRARRSLSSIDRLPDAGVPAAQWAFDRLQEGRMIYVEILTGLNDRLGLAGLKPISASAFGRHARAVTEGRKRRPMLPSDPITADSIAAASAALLAPDARTAP